MMALFSAFAFSAQITQYRNINVYFKVLPQLQMRDGNNNTLLPIPLHYVSENVLIKLPKYPRNKLFIDLHLS